MSETYQRFKQKRISKMLKTLLQFKDSTVKLLVWSRTVILLLATLLR